MGWLRNTTLLKCLPPLTFHVATVTRALRGIVYSSCRTHMALSRLGGTACASTRTSPSPSVVPDGVRNAGCGLLRSRHSLRDSSFNILVSRCCDLIGCGATIKMVEAGHTLSFLNRLPLGRSHDCETVVRLQSWHVHTYGCKALFRRERRSNENVS